MRSTGMKRQSTAAFRGAWPMTLQKANAKLTIELCPCRRTSRSVFTRWSDRVLRVSGLPHSVCFQPGSPSSSWGRHVPLIVTFSMAAGLWQRSKQVSTYGTRIQIVCWTRRRVRLILVVTCSTAQAQSELSQNDDEKCEDANKTPRLCLPSEILPATRCIDELPEWVFIALAQTLLSTLIPRSHPKTPSRCKRPRRIQTIAIPTTAAKPDLPDRYRNSRFSVLD